MSSFDLRVPDCYHPSLVIDLRIPLVISLQSPCCPPRNYAYRDNAMLPHPQMTILCAKAVSSADSAVY
jgi:hypothetical protein